MSATVMFLFCLGFPAMAYTATLGVTGRIPCQGHMVLVNAGPSLQGSGSGRSVTVRPSGTEGGTFSVVLALRTNCAYSLAAAIMGAGDQEIKIAAPLVTAAGGHGHLSAQALQAITSPTDLKPGAPAVCVQGQAVSRGGTNTTSDNAILIEFSLPFPPGAPGAAVVFTLNLKN